MTTVVADASTGATGVVADLIQGPAGSLASPTGTGYVHVTSGTIDGAAQPINLAGGSTYVTGILPLANMASPTGTGPVTVTSGVVNAASAPIQLAGGSGWVTGNLPIGNIAPSGTNGYWLTTTGGAVAWAALSVAPTNLTPGTAGQVMLSNATPAAAWTTVTGDTTISATGVTTTASIHGATVPAAGSLTIGNVLQVSGSSALTYGPLAAGGISPGTAGQLLITNATPATAWVSVSGDSTISATGSMVNTAIHGATVPAAGALTTGNVLQVSGASALSYAAVNLAGGAGYVTGILPAANQAAQTMGGDCSGTTAACTVLQAQGGDIVFMTSGLISSKSGSTYAGVGYNGTPIIWWNSAGAGTCYMNPTGGTAAFTVFGSTGECGCTGSLALGSSVGGSYGGGAGGIISMANATTQPSSAPSGGLVLAASSGSLAIYDSSGYSVTISGSGAAFTHNAIISAATQTSANGATLTLQSGGSSGANLNGGLLSITAGSGTGTGTSAGGGVTVTSGGSTNSTAGTLLLQSGNGSAANGATTLSTGKGTTYGALGVVSSGNTPGTLGFLGAGLSTTQSTGGGGKATLNVATGSFLFAPASWNGIAVQIVLCV